MIVILICVKWYFIVVLICIFLILVMLSIFSCAYWPSICLFSFSIHFSIGFLKLLNCISCFYILEIKPLSIISFANIFSQCKDCLCILFMVSLVVQKLISLIISHLNYLLLFQLPSETDLNHWYNLCRECFAYVFF